jgi:type I restriction enzyme S subunit
MTKSTNPIPKGYKLTKIGVLPVEWEVVKLENILSKIESGTSVNCSIGSESDKRILKTSAVTLGAFLPSETKTPIVDEEDKLSTQVKAGHILVCRKNSPSLVGSSVLVESLDQDLFLPDLLWQLIPNENYREISNFLFYALNEGHTAFRIRNLASGSSESMRNISKKSYLNLYLPHPPQTPQQKIAKILATWDQAIQTQSQLINAKKEQKRGLMQRLLTGEVRLPGFEGERRYTSLADVVLKTKGKIVSTNTERTGKPYVGASNFSGNYTFYSHNPEKAVECLSTDVLMLWDGENAGAVSTNHIGFVSSTVARLRPKEGNSGQYLFHYLDFYNGKIRATRTGSGIPHVARDLLKIFTFDLPNQKEQIAIAEVLQAADKELTLLETYLTELREQKRGLMQRLLTGAVRVTVPATA